MKYWLPSLVWAAFIFYLSHQSSPPGRNLAPDFVGHALLYSILAATLVLGISRGGRTPLTTYRAFLACLIALVYGALDEYHQSFVGGRVPSMKDFLVDAAAAGVTIAVLCKILRRVARHPRSRYHGPREHQTGRNRHA